MKMQIVVASEAKQSSFLQAKLDCFVAALLAMTSEMREIDQ
jgi:hypothetical protein